MLGSVLLPLVLILFNSFSILKLSNSLNNELLSFKDSVNLWLISSTTSNSDNLYNSSFTLKLLFSSVFTLSITSTGIFWICSEAFTIKLLFNINA